MSAPSTHKSTGIKALAVLASGEAQSVRVPLHCRVQLQTLTRVKHGGERETLIPTKATQQPVWALCSANDDGVCIAYATMCFPGDSTYMWLGGWSKVCHSNIYLFGTGHKPLCHWIDRDGQKKQRRAPWRRTRISSARRAYNSGIDKTLWPVCAGEEVADDCFDKDAQVPRTGGLSARDSQYDEIIDWTAD
ncbi:hypothetical protein DL767_006505 [Monosporascus sp. MG133]|nr:hypothetical protein DL767_006505 [Monosporascus sp. MG133]